MKKIVLLIMSVLMVISMTGCPNPTNPPTPKTITVLDSTVTVNANGTDDAIVSASYSGFDAADAFNLWEVKYVDGVGVGVLYNADFPTTFTNPFNFTVQGFALGTAGTSGTYKVVCTYQNPSNWYVVESENTFTVNVID